MVAILVTQNGGEPCRAPDYGIARLQMESLLAVPGDGGRSAQRGHSVIRCKPNGICSWDFLLDGEGHRSKLQFNCLSEQGAIVADRKRFDVQKHGVFSGHWTLDQAGTELASAQKSTAFTRTFDVQDSSGLLVLSAESAFGRSFRVERSGNVIATMFPDHPFTRRANIDILIDKWDFVTISFLFWLVVLTWRRAAQSNS